MRLVRCVACDLPVLELDGQFEKLDSFYINDGQPPVESAGYWHVRCLRASPFGPAWHDARVQNFCSVRGYTRVAELPGWTVIQHPRSSERLAIGQSGELLSLPASRKNTKRVEGGWLVPRVEREYI